MENREFYIKYLNYQPVSIDISYGRGPQGRLPLVTVAHLIVACTLDQTRRLLGLPEDYGPLTLHFVSNGEEVNYNSWDHISALGENGKNGANPLIIKSSAQGINYSLTVGINAFLANTLPNIKKNLAKPGTTGTARSNPKTPRIYERWASFKEEAARYVYPTTPIGMDVMLPPTREIEITSENSVQTVIRMHLDNLNRIFHDEGFACRFKDKANSATVGFKGKKLIGVPDNVFTLDSSILSFIEVKTPNDLPVRISEDREFFDLLEMYQEDIQYVATELTRGDIGRMEVRTLIDQVYGYLALNNMIYGCVTCYEVTYFLWRPKRGTLKISDPIFNQSSSPTLLQALYYFAYLSYNSRDSQTLTESPKDDAFDQGTTGNDQNTVSEEMDISESTSTQGASSYGNNDSDLDQNSGNYGSDTNRHTKYNLNLDSLQCGTVVGSGATGQVIRLHDSNIVVKTCDSYNNPDGFEMLQNEISVYEKLSKLNLGYVPRYFGACDLYGQYFLALEYIPGEHCDWRRNGEFRKKMYSIVRDMKSHGIVHGDLRPENVLLTDEGDIKLIDFGMATIDY